MHTLFIRGTKLTSVQISSGVSIFTTQQSHAIARNLQPLQHLFDTGLRGEPQERHQTGVRGQHPVLGVIVLQGGQVFEIVDCFLHGIIVENDRSLCNDLVSSIAKNLFFDYFRR